MRVGNGYVYMGLVKLCGWGTDRIYLETQDTCSQRLYIPTFLGDGG
jgi:hypothetical protein